MRRFLVAMLLSLMCVVLAAPSVMAASGNEILESAEAAEPDEEEIEENYEAAKKNMKQIYYGALDELSDEEGPMNVPFPKWLYMKFYRFYYTLRNAAPYICAISFFGGILLMAVSQQNKRIQRMALLYMVILIPIATFVIVLAAGSSPLFKPI